MIEIACDKATMELGKGINPSMYAKLEISMEELLRQLCIADVLDSIGQDEVLNHFPNLVVKTPKPH